MSTGRERIGRVAWFVALWLTGVGALGAVAWGLRAMMRGLG